MFRLIFRRSIASRSGLATIPETTSKLPRQAAYLQGCRAAQDAAYLVVMHNGRARRWGG